MLRITFYGSKVKFHHRHVMFTEQGAQNSVNNNLCNVL